MIPKEQFLQHCADHYDKCVAAGRHYNVSAPQFDRIESKQTGEIIMNLNVRLMPRKQTQTLMESQGE